MKNNYSKLPKTISELEVKNPLLHEEFLRQKNKYGVTFKEFTKSLSSK